jgi:undecaprenyl-diphosphatase
MSTEVLRRGLRRLPRLEQFAGRTFAGLLAIVVAGTVFGLLLMLVRFKWTPLYNLDHGAASSLNAVASTHPALVAVLRAITQFGGHTILWWVVTVAAAGLLVRRQAQLAAYLVVTGLGALALDPTLKLLVGRLRPVVAAPVASAPGNSFPSGHALGSIVSYGALLLVFLPAVPRRLRPLAVAGTAAIVVAIGFTRVALGVHYVSDVLAGWALGLVWLGITATAFRVWRRKIGRPVPDKPLEAGLAPEAASDVKPAVPEHPRHAGHAVAGLLVGFVLLVGALFGLGMLVRTHTPGWDVAIPRWFAAHRSPRWNGAAYFWSQAGNTHAILGVSLVAAPIALAALRRWRAVLFLVVTMFGELLSFLAVANTVRRPRPPVSNLDGHLPTGSFPSGHLAATVCLYGAIAVLVLTHTRAWWRWLFVAAAVVMPTFVLLSRLYRGEHHPTDLIGGLLLGLTWLAVTTRMVRPGRNQVDPATAPDTTPAPRQTTPAIRGAGELAGS